MGVIYACNKDAQVNIISFITFMSLFYYNGSRTVSICQRRLHAKLILKYINFVIFFSYYQ